MTDDSLKKYLKENASPVPPESLGEAARIWHQIDANQKRFRLWWKVLPALAATAVLAFVVHSRQLKNEAKIEEDYLFQEWNAMMADVNSEENELMTAFEK